MSNRLRNHFWIGPGVTSLFYFEIFGLPNIVMILHQDTQKLRNAVEEMMVGLENAKKINLFRKNTNSYSSVQLKTLTTLTENENSEKSSNNDSFCSDNNENYNENEKKLDEKM